MKRSTDRILTTHTGSLPRPADLIRTMFAREEGVPGRRGRAATRASAPPSPRSCRKQVDAGIDIVNDGEMSKPGYATYVKDRLTGFGGESHAAACRDLRRLPGAWPSACRRSRPLAAQDPGLQRPDRVERLPAVRADIDNLKAAPRSGRCRGRVHDAASPGVIALFLGNEYYRSHEAYLVRARGRDGDEYEAIARRRLHPAGRLPGPRHGPSHPVRRPRPRGVPQDGRAARRGAQRGDWRTSRPSRCACTSAGATTRARTTTTSRSATSSTSCSRHGPPAISFEGANPRHEHEWKVFEDVKLPRGQDPDPRRASTPRPTSSSIPSSWRSASCATPRSSAART